MRATQLRYYSGTPQAGGRSQLQSIWCGWTAAASTSRLVGARPQGKYAEAYLKSANQDARSPAKLIENWRRQRPSKRHRAAKLRSHLPNFPQHRAKSVGKPTAHPRRCSSNERCSQTQMQRSRSDGIGEIRQASYRSLHRGWALYREPNRHESHQPRQQVAHEPCRAPRVLRAHHQCSEGRFPWQQLP